MDYWKSLRKNVEDNRSVEAAEQPPNSLYSILHFYSVAKTVEAK